MTPKGKFFLRIHHQRRHISQFSYKTQVDRLSKTVGICSSGNLFSVYDTKRQVFPTHPSPTTTHFTVFI